jgi:hypothetical protein
MPALTRWFIKSALVYFAVALLVGVVVMARPVLALPAELVALTPVYFHLLMVGWVTQLIFGVVYWMFPKYSQAQPRGNERLGWATYLLLNAGLLLRIVGEPLEAIRPEAGAGWMLAGSAVLQLLAGWVFIANTWPRVKER